MVRNQGVHKTEAGEPITEERWVDVDPHVAFEHGDLVACDGDDLPRVVVEFTDRDGDRHEVEGDVVRFDAWSNYSGAPGGHNILIRTDDEWVQAHDPEDDYLRVSTRRGTGESVVEVNRPGAGLNKRVASDRTPGDNIVVRLPDAGVDEDAFDAVTGEHDDDYADTVEVVGTRDVERQYGDGEVETTAVLRYTVEEPTGNTLSYDINAVRIGCPDCKTNTTALIRPDGSYECVCGYSNDLTSRATLFHQQTEVDGVWYPY